MKCFFPFRLFITIILSFSALSLQAGETVFYVSPTGDDRAEGSETAPWKSFAGAAENVKAYRRAHPKTAIRVLFGGGIYPMNTPVRLSAENGGTAEAPVVYAARPGEYPVFSGAVALDKWARTAETARLDPSVRGKIWQTDLKKAGITRYGSAIGRDDRPDLYFRGKRQTPARWPNEGFTQSGKAKGATPLPPTWLGCDGTKEGVFEYLDDRISRWAKEPDAALNGYWYWDWSESYQQIEKIDPVSKTITLTPPFHNYGYRDGFRYYGLNLLCELDTPGEYYLDRDKGILYWYAPEDFDPQHPSAELSVLESPFMLEAEGCTSLTLEGLAFRGGRGNGLRIAGGTDVAVRGCRIEQFGCDAVHINGGTGHTVSGCLIRELGCSGIAADGGDRRNLVPSGFRIEQNIVESFSLFKHTYEPAVLFSGMGIAIRHNSFRESSSSALRIEGSDVLIEYNRFADLVKESDDQGGLDMWYNPSYRGVVIRYNHWRNIVGGTHNGAAGVRLDDMISGVEVYGNVFEKCGAVIFGAVQIHGGKDNRITDNLFYDCYAAVSFTPWGAERWKSALERPEMRRKLYEEVDVTSPAYLQRWPELGDLTEGADRNVVRNNLAVNCPTLFLRDHGQNDLQNNTLLDITDKSLPYYVRPEVLAKYLVKPIPYREMGPTENRWAEKADLD